MSDLYIYLPAIVAVIVAFLISWMAYGKDSTRV
jgi:hypothetical protein